MDFFEQQELARRNTRRLVLLLTLAVTAIIATTILVFAVATAGFKPFLLESGQSFWVALYYYHGWQPFALIAVFIVLMVLTGAAVKWLQLRSGGQAVAEALGGQRIPGNTSLPEQRRLLNIVEEMAIASGTPVPPVYLMDEPGINAFAAGHGTHDAVIGITKGALHTLNREELQGVIAHEFSHILNGDMRLNLRLVAILNGILLIGLLGELLLRSGSLPRSRKNAQGGQLALAGLGLILLGAVGTFFGRWIKAAVSRQREFLADASAVQYTRNPEGISGALLKIGGHTNGSRLQAADASEFSHMYFGEGVRVRFHRLMATHPPLEARIRRVWPQWDGRFPTPSKNAETQSPTAETPSSSEHRGDSQRERIQAVLSGVISAESLHQARELLDQIPTALREAAQEPFSARGVLAGLLLSRTPSDREMQWHILQQQWDAPTLAQLTPVIELAEQTQPSHRLPLIELSLPSLTALSEPQKKDYLTLLDQLARADQRIVLSEWIICRLAQTHLNPKPIVTQRLQLKFCRDEARTLLSVAALISGARATSAYEAGAQALEETRPMLSRHELSFDQLDQAVERLRHLQPLSKPKLLKALHQCLVADKLITTSETELYRTLADALDCPVPPLNVPDTR